MSRAINEGKSGGQVEATSEEERADEAAVEPVASSDVEKPAKGDSVAADTSSDDKKEEKKEGGDSW
jgi:hypothetical protein